VILAALGVASAIALSACGGNDNDNKDKAASSTPTTAATTTPTTSASTATAAKVSANTASVAELQQAFAAAGFPSAARWAHEVEEYRPYPADDLTFAKLRKELAKYNPVPGVVDRIIATLTP
jgi:peptidoglycan hydrolase-like protein with peptidoglycan-binding domain